MARKRRRPDYDDLTQAEAQAAQRKLRAYLAKRTEPEPDRIWNALTALTPAQRAQLMDEFRALVDALCSQACDPLPPLRPGDAGEIVADVDTWLGGAL